MNFIDKDNSRPDRPLEFWHQYSAATLTTLCKKFGLPHSGDKATKAARLFVAYENGYDPVYNGNIDEALREDYRSKLNDADGEAIFSDPLQIDISEWAQEPRSFTAVPSTFTLVSILRYHDRITVGTVDEMSNFDNFLNSDAFKLFQSGHVKQLFAYDVPGQEIKVFRTRCAAEMTISDEKDVWFAMKSTSGEILTGHCTCMAGMSSRCKHLFACLFKIEFIVRSMLNDPSVTDGDRQWGLPATRDVTAPQLVKDLDWSQDIFGKTPSYALNSVEKREYAATESPLEFNTLLDDLKAIAPRAAVSRVLSTEKEQDTLYIFVNTMKKSNADVKEVLKDMRLKYGNLDNRNQVEKATRHHLESKELSAKGEELWQQHRRLRITASFAHTAYRKARQLRTLFAGKTADEIKASTATETLTQTLLDKLKGISRFASHRLPVQMAWGKEKEDDALKAYLEQTTVDKSCANFKVDRPGLIIASHRPYLGATPDAIVGCECHGRRVVELKCPYTCNDADETKEPKPIDEAPFWCAIEKKKTGRLILRRTDPYFIQCQMQMAMTGIYECDFFAWAPIGTGTGIQKEPELIVFDPDLWENVERDLCWFYESVFLPFYLSSV